MITFKSRLPGRVDVLRDRKIIGGITQGHYPPHQWFIHLDGWNYDNYPNYQQEFRLLKDAKIQIGKCYPEG